MDSQTVSIGAQQDDWDAEGFQIPSLKPASQGPQARAPPREKSVSSAQSGGKQTLYLGPHGAPPSQLKQEMRGGAARKNRLRQKLKLKEADNRKQAEAAAAAARASCYENKVENLRDLMGTTIAKSNTAGSTDTSHGRFEWLDPFCHESQFEKAI